MNHFYRDIPGYMSNTNIECFDYVLERLPAGNINWIELGSFSGKSAAYCVVELINKKQNFTFSCVDIWENGMQESFEKNILPIAEHVNFSKNYSYDEANKYDDNSIDVCYVDGDHSYEGVTKDLNAWWPKLKTGAIFFGDDFTKGFPGVGKAVKEFFTPKRIKFIRIGRCWVVVKP
jgi:hypothetical protein